MQKTAAFFIPYFWAPHLETDFELMHKHLETGESVTAYICNSELPTCYSNVAHDLHICNLCKYRRRNGLRITGLEDKVHLRNFLDLTPSDMKVLAKYKGLSIQTREELLEITIDNFDLGVTIYNELVCQKAESDPDLIQSSEYVTRAIESGALVYLSFKNLLNATKPDIFYTFNGRFVIGVASVKAAEATGTPYAVHDRADGAMNRYTVVHNDTLNSLSLWKQEIEKLWEQSTDSIDERRSIGSAWFDQRAKSQRQSWFSLTSYQVPVLPTSFDASKENIVFFNSTEWEYALMEDYRLPFYSSQNDGIWQLARDLQHLSEFQCYLRVHPNLKEKQNSQTEFILSQLSNMFSNFEVIPAESQVSTYELMKHASLVVSFGSTTGIEAAYHRIPSLLLGRSVYEGLNATFVAKSHEEAVKFIEQKRYKMNTQELNVRSSNAIKYGYFQHRSGTPYDLFEQTDVFEMTCKKPIGQTSIVSYDAPSYDEGLKRELAQRLELLEREYNPLATTLKELQSVTNDYAKENARLQAEIAHLNGTIESLRAGSKRRRYIRKIGMIKRSLEEKLRRLVKP